MNGLCVIGKMSKIEQTFIITKVGFTGLHTIGFNIIKDFNWSDKEISKLCLSEKAANKLFNKLKTSEYIKLFEHVEIKQIDIDLNKNINIV